jgi:hypothetical protein
MLQYSFDEQMRIHSSTDCDFYLRVRSKPIIEHSSRVRFAPLELSNSGVASKREQFDQLLNEKKLGEETGHFAQVGA